MTQAVEFGLCARASVNAGFNFSVRIASAILIGVFFSTQRLSVSMASRMPFQRPSPLGESRLDVTRSIMHILCHLRSVVPEVVMDMRNSSPPCGPADFSSNRPSEQAERISLK